MNPAKPSPATAVSLSQKDTDLGLAWKDPSFIPMLCPANVMDYFSNQTNPFYDPQCNNEIIRMQRQSLDQLRNMVGIEYELAHMQDPILYVIKKQHRTSPTEAMPLAYYYVLAGEIFQAPDLWSVMNSRLLNTSHFLYAAAAELNNFVRFHPSNGHHWEIKNAAGGSRPITFAPIDPARKEPEEAGTQFQRKNVDHILGLLTQPQRFPFKPMPTTQHPYGPRVLAEQASNNNAAAVPMAPPPADAAPVQERNAQNPGGRPDHQLFNSVKNSR